MMFTPYFFVHNIFTMLLLYLPFRYHSISVVLHSKNLSYNLVSMVLSSLKAGACDFIAKPFRADELLEAIDRNLTDTCHYNLNTINTLLEDQVFNKKTENIALSQIKVNNLLNICKQNCTNDSSEVIEFLNSVES
jgi:DNA-binding NtrC family response regulator